MKEHPDLGKTRIGEKDYCNSKTFPMSETCISPAYREGLSLTGYRMSRQREAESLQGKPNEQGK